LFELDRNNIPVDKINELLQDLRRLNKLVVIDRKNEDIKKAKKFDNWQDALHAVLARKCHAQYLVTRNITDYSEVKDLVEIKLPENL